MPILRVLRVTPRTRNARKAVGDIMFLYIILLKVRAELYRIHKVVSRIRAYKPKSRERLRLSKKGLIVMTFARHSED